MFSHTAASWAEAEVILSYFILILQIEFEDTRLQLSKHYIIKLIEVSYLLCAEKVMVYMKAHPRK